MKSAIQLSDYFATSFELLLKYGQFLTDKFSDFNSIAKMFSQKHNGKINIQHTMSMNVQISIV